MIFLLNDLFLDGQVVPGLKPGLSKSKVEEVLNMPLEDRSIDTPDLDYYYVELPCGLVLSMQFDKDEICFEIGLDLEQNKTMNLILKIDEYIEKVSEDITFDALITILFKLNIDWHFDIKRTYSKTVCIHSKNGVKFYYSFEDRVKNDYGLFSLRLLLDGHKLVI
jgi:hypothetical protein